MRKLKVFNFIRYTIVISLFLFSNKSRCATAGSDNSVELPQSYFYFSASENSTNKVANYAIMDNGFYLQDSSTTCSFASVFPVKGGNVNLNDGRLFLFRDLIFSSTAQNIFSSGKVHGNYHSVIFSDEMDELDYSFDFINAGITLNGDLTFDAPIKFYGTTFINGQGNCLILGDQGSISVESGGQLLLENVEIVSLKNQNVSCKQNDASITIKNSRLNLSADFEFDTGSMLFESDVVISGTNKFSYSTTMASTIKADSILYVNNGATFEYAPATNNRNLICMTDSTSWLWLDGCTLRSTETGIRLTSGTLFLDNLVTLYAEGSSISEAICFGNNNSDNDLNIEMLAGAQLSTYGRLEYENTA